LPRVTETVTPPAAVLTRWRWTITAAFGLGGITVSAWGPRLPAIKAALGIGTATIGLLLAGVTVGAILGLLASTPTLHWLGGRRATVGALLLIAGAMTAMGLALIVASVPFLAAALVLAGFGIGLLDVLINVDGAAVERAVGRTVMPMMHAAWSIGAAAGSGIGAACAALGVSPSDSSSPRPPSSPRRHWPERRESLAGTVRPPRSQGRAVGPSSASGCTAGWTGGSC
jgi:MFS family permease